MSSLVTILPFAIHLGLDERGLARLEEDARSHGMSVFRIALSDVHDQAALVDHLSATFMFPHPVTGLDATLDLISDLAWFGNDQGYLVVARGLVEGSAVAEDFVSMLPNIIDRQRSGGVTFIVALDSAGRGLQSALAAANREMEQAGDLPWAQPGTGPVDVVVHRDDELHPGAAG